MPLATRLQVVLDMRQMILKSTVFNMLQATLLPFSYPSGVLSRFYNLADGPNQSLSIFVPSNLTGKVFVIHKFEIQLAQ